MTTTTTTTTTTSSSSSITGAARDLRLREGISDIYTNGTKYFEVDFKEGVNNLTAGVDSDETQYTESHGNNLKVSIATLLFGDAVDYDSLSYTEHQQLVDLVLAEAVENAEKNAGKNATVAQVKHSIIWVLERYDVDTDNLGNTNNDTTLDTNKDKIGEGIQSLTADTLCEALGGGRRYCFRRRCHNIL